METCGLRLDEGQLFFVTFQAPDMSPAQGFICKWEELTPVRAFCFRVGSCNPVQVSQLHVPVSELGVFKAPASWGCQED